MTSDARAPGRQLMPLDASELLQLTVRESGSGTLIEVRGEVCLLTAPRVGAALDSALRGSSPIVLDLRGVSFFDASGLRVLLPALRTARARGRRLLVLRGPAVERVLRAAGVAHEAGPPPRPVAASAPPEPGGALRRVRLPIGTYDVTAFGRALALWILTGLVERETVIGRTRALELLGPRDLVPLTAAPDVAGLDAGVLTVVAEATVVVFDDVTLERLRAGGAVLERLLEATAEQQRRMSAHRAICQMPRVEDRIMALFALLAERWGQVTPEGIRLSLPLKHEAIGRLIGARRPTVSLALKKLAVDERLRRRDDGLWLLDAGSLLGDALDVPAAPRRLTG